MKKIFKTSLLIIFSTILIACGQQNPGTAAYVGNYRITEEELSYYLNDLRKVVPIENNDQGTSQSRGVLARLIIGQIISQAVTETGAIVDQSLVAKDYDALEKQTGGSDALAVFAGSRNVPPLLIKEVLSQNRVLDAIGKVLAPDSTIDNQRFKGEEYVILKAGANNVKINPRFGKWIPEDGSIAPPANEFSEPAFGLPEDVAPGR